MVKHLIDKQTLKHDLIRESMWDFVGYLNKKRKWVILGGVVVLLLVASIAGGFAYQNFRLQEETIRFYRVEKLITETGLEGKKALEDTKKELSAFLEEYPNGQLAPLALMFKAKIAWIEKDLDSAQKDYRHVMDHSSSTATNKNLATIGLAKLHETRGEYDEAIRLYKTLPEKPYADLKAVSLGRIAIAQNKPAEAKQHFEQVTKQFPPSSLAPMARDAISNLP